MAWPLNVSTGQVITAAHINSIKNSLFGWGGNVDAKTYNLSNAGIVTAVTLQGSLNWSYIVGAPAMEALPPKAGAALKYLRVNAGETATEWSADDSLPSKVGNALKVLRVASGEASVEWSTPTVAWGQITGTLANQTDLNTALSGKANTSHNHAASNITSGTMADARIAASNVTQHQGSLSLTIAQTTGLQTALDGKEPLLPSRVGNELKYLRVSSGGAWELAAVSGGGGDVAQISFGTSIPSGVRYYSPSAVTSNASIGLRQWNSPRAGTLRNLYIRMSANTHDGDVTFVLSVNGVDSALAILWALGNTATDLSNLVNSVAVNQGDLITFKTNNQGASATATAWSASWEFA